MKFEIEPLVVEILDQLPDSVWSSKTSTFFDPAIGGGQFVRAIEQRLRNTGHSDANIRSRVFGFEESDLHIRFAVNKYKLVGQYIRKPYDKFFELDNSMKFDVVIGNPPFQKSGGTAKRWTLWEQFLQKCLTLDAGIVTLVVPQSLTSPGAAFDSIKSRCRVLNLAVKRHFKVGSTFCYFIVDLTQEVTETLLITEDGQRMLDIRNLPFVPGEVTDQSLALLDKLLSRQKRSWWRGELHTSRQDLFSDTGEYSVIHTNAQTLKTDTIHSNLNKIRVVVTLSGYPKFQVITNAYASQATFWCEFESIGAAEEFAAECNGDEIQNMLNLFKWSGWNSREVISLL